MALIAVGCGKKGNPLPPLVRVPDAVAQITARRVADEVLLTLAAPTVNVDKSTPVALARIDVYGYTGGTAPPQARFTDVADLIATIKPDPATAITPIVRDTLSADELVAGRPLPRGRETTSSNPVANVSDAKASALKRFYMAVAFSDRGRAGPPSPVVEIPLTLLPDPPPEVRATVTAEGVVLGWDPSGGLIGFLLEHAPFPSASPLDDGPAAASSATLSPGPTRYNVYRQPSGESTLGAPAQEEATATPSPVNPAPLEALTFADQVESDGRQWCYTVSAIRESRGTVIEGRQSVPVCVVAVDVFPPAAPRGVSPIAAEGSVSLVWEANDEPDLAGYFVWRGEAGDEQLVRITDQVVAETRFTDGSVRPGVHYVYAVTAVDKQTPEPNVSPESERVEVTAR